jgi:hypothetical protein
VYSRIDFSSALFRNAHGVLSGGTRPTCTLQQQKLLYIPFEHVGVVPIRATALYNFECPFLKKMIAPTGHADPTISFLFLHRTV